MFRDHHGLCYIAFISLHFGLGKSKKDAFFYEAVKVYYAVIFAG